MILTITPSLSLSLLLSCPFYVLLHLYSLLLSSSPSSLPPLSLMSRGGIDLECCSRSLGEQYDHEVPLIHLILLVRVLGGPVLMDILIYDPIRGSLLGSFQRTHIRDLSGVLRSYRAYIVVIVLIVFKVFCVLQYIDY